MENINSILEKYQLKRDLNLGPKSYLEFLVSEAAEKLNAQGHEQWILKCFKKNKAATERALALTLETKREKTIKCPGALFTWWFKKLVSN